jgi:hypothetical protein
VNDEVTGDEKLKKAFSGPEGTGGTGGGCPGDETIWAAARGELPPDRVQEILAHSLDCPDCEESFRMAAGIMVESRDAAVRHFPMRRRFVLAVGAIAAAILVMIALPALLRRGAAPPSPAPLDATVATMMWRVGVDGDEPLADGGRIRPGDRLFMTLESDEPVHLYVINQDDRGEASALFPIEGAQWSNPLQPGAIRRIPGETTWDYDSWEVSSAGGRDAFIVVAAREPIPRLQASLDLLAAAAPLDPGEYVRGGDAGEPPVSAESRRALEALLHELAAASESGEAGLILRRIVLENPR